MAHESITVNHDPASRHGNSWPHSVHHSQLWKSDKILIQKPLNLGRFSWVPWTLKSWGDRTSPLGAQKLCCHLMCLKSGVIGPNQELLPQKKTTPASADFSLTLHAVVWMNTLKYPYVEMGNSGGGFVIYRSRDWWENLRSLELCPQGLSASICSLSLYVQLDTGAFCS